SAWARQTFDDAGANRISRGCENDRDHRCRLPGRERRESVVRNDHIDLEPGELGGDLGQSLAASLRPPIFAPSVAALAPAKLTQSLDKGGGPFPLCRCRPRAQQTHERGFAPLRARPARPRRGRAAEQRDELAPLHSITSSARRRKDSGIFSPIALAVVRL